MSYKVAVVGCGAIVNNDHLPAIAQVNSLNVTCFVDKNEAYARKMAARHGVDYRSDINGIPEETDIVLIAVPNFLHSSLSIEALKRGFNVLCEKPMAINQKQCDQLVEEVENAGRLFALVHQLRFHSTVTYLKKLLLDGLLGRILNFDISYGAPFGWISRTQFYESETQAGGGVLMDLGCHLIDLARFLIGNICDAEMAVAYDRHLKGRMDKAITAKLEFSNGLKGYVRASRLAYLENEVTVIGENGRIRASLQSPDIFLDIPGHTLCENGPVKFKADGNNAFVVFWEHVAGTLNGNENGDHLAGPMDGRRTIALIDKLYTSSNAVAYI